VKVIARAFDESIPVGSVVTTNPGPGDDINKNGQIGLTLSIGPARYDVPTLTGKTEAEAGQILEDNHLVVGEATRVYNDTVKEGFVITSDPAPGTSLQRDTAVSLVVSKGAQPVDVPDVTGKSLDDAKTALKDAGLRGKVTQEKYDEQVTAGDVISQSPKNGQARKDSVVQLVVSKGPPLVSVPDVVGRSIGDARSILESAGFHVRAFGPGVGSVFRQSPSGGQAPKGSTITLFYL
jgi:beta-lactam-binding protein with PASTA domain